MTLLGAYYHDYSLYRSCMESFDCAAAENAREIIREYHILEKGLTMPETRMGFGTEVAGNLARRILRCTHSQEDRGEHIRHAARVLLEYLGMHRKRGYPLDAGLVESIKCAVNAACVAEPTEQPTLTAAEYLAGTSAQFPEFARSRKSLRNYARQPLDPARLQQALELAATAPSACNRQAWRTYLVRNKETASSILDLQGGARGFGHLADSLIIVCANLGMFSGTCERNQAYVDGGIYAMNLLYALHYHRIGACILNCCHTPEKDKTMRAITNIRDDEVFIAMILCGNVPDSFKVAMSPRAPISASNRAS